MNHNCQAPLSMGFPRQEYWSELPWPLPEDLPDSGIESPSPGLTGRFFTTEPPGKPNCVNESEVTQLWPTLCDPMGCGPPGSSVHGIFQARILKWVAIFSSRVSSQPRDETWVSCIARGLLTVWANREVIVSLVPIVEGQFICHRLHIFLMIWPETFSSIICTTSPSHPRQVKPPAAGVGSRNIAALLDLSACMCGDLSLPDSALWCPLLWSHTLPPTHRRPGWALLGAAQHSPYWTGTACSDIHTSNKAYGPGVTHSGLELLSRSLLMQSNLWLSRTCSEQSKLCHKH